MATDIQQRIRGVMEELWNRGNLGYADEVCSPSYRGHLTLVGDLDREGFKQMVRTFRSAFPDLRMQPEDLIFAGNEVVVRWSATGTQTGQLMGIAPTGRAGDTTGIDIFRLEGDKIVEHWGEWDALRVLQYAGVVPSLGARPSAAAQPSPPAH